MADLDVSDPAMGGPSAELAPGMMRRTVYGRVSRYKLDTYLQLFDFPRSEERRVGKEC